MFYSLIIKLPILRTNASSFIFDPQKVPTRSNLLSKTTLKVEYQNFFFYIIFKCHNAQRTKN